MALTRIRSIWLKSREVIFEHVSAVIVWIYLEETDRQGGGAEVKVVAERLKDLFKSSRVQRKPWPNKLPCVVSYGLYASVELPASTWSYLSICPCVPRTEWVTRVISRYMLLRRFLHLTRPWSLHAMGRHKDPCVPQRVITQVLVVWGVKTKDNSVCGHSWCVLLNLPSIVVTSDLLSINKSLMNK